MVGIDVSEKSIKVVEVSDGQNPSLHTVCWSAISNDMIKNGVVQDKEEMAQALSLALGKCTPVPVTGKRVVVSIPESQSFVRVLDLPQMSDEETDEAVQWAVRHHIPFDLERVYIDWQPVGIGGADNNRRQILVGAAQRIVVDPLLEVLDSLKLQVEALELEAQAIVRSLLPFQAQDVQGVLIVDLGAEATNVIYFDQGAMRFTTSIRKGGEYLTEQLAQNLRIQPGSAAEKKALVGITSASADDAQVAAVLRGASLEIVQQIEQVVREVAVPGASDSGVRAIILSGGSANMPGLVSVFNEVFVGVPTQLSNPLINLTSERGAVLSGNDAVHFATAIGLALREACEEGS